MKLLRKESHPVVEMLGRTPIWNGLSNQDLNSIVRSAKDLRYNAGEVIIKKGESGVGFYLILDGSVEVKSGETVLSKLGPGQFFGEMSVIDDEPRSADVITVEPSRCLVLTAWSFDALISEHPKIAMKMLREFVRSLRGTDEAFGE
jgi:CRP-like cAMP-binding protein